MKCPFRVDQNVKEAHNFSTKKTYYNIEQTFPECYMDSCPYYSKEDDTCFRVGAEMVQVGLGIIKGEQK